MLIFGAYKRQRLALKVKAETTVLDLKEVIQSHLGISGDLDRRDNKVLVLSYAGAELADHWILSDLVMVSGTTVKIELRDNVKPALYLRCSHSQETIKVFEDASIASMKLEQFRSVASMLSGLPVGIFRLTTRSGCEMFDSHTLEDYGVREGHVVLLETWDGWNEFLNMAIMGFTPQVVAQVSADDVVARFQMKVALFVASHFGHVDLARCALRQGVRSDEPTGYHPSRRWCQENGHIDSLKCPVHEATQSGQVGVLRLFVNHDIACLKAKDGYGLEPLNIALRRRVKNCASFLLSKQWVKVPISKTCSLHVGTYAILRSWCDRAKDRAFLKYGPERSSQKQRSFSSGPLVSHGIFLDGFSRSPMTGKSKVELMKVEKEAREKGMGGQRPQMSLVDGSGFSSEPEHYFKSLLLGNGGKMRQRQRKVSIRWHKSSVSSCLSTGEGVAVGPTRSSLKVKPQASISNSPKTQTSTPHSSKPKTPSVTTTDDSQTDDNDAAKPSSSIQSLSMRRTSQSLINFGQDELKEKPDTIKPGSDVTKIHEHSHYKSENIKATSNYHPSPSRGMPSTSSFTTQSQNLLLNSNPTNGRQSLKGKIQTRPSETSEDALMGEDKRGSFKKRKSGSQKFVLSMSGASIKGTVSLPDISLEQNRRPFYYYNGVREDELVNEALKLVTKYKGDSSRERALTTLNLASSFSEKPWLYRVKLALNLTSKSVKRNVRRLQEQV